MQQLIVGAIVICAGWVVVLRYAPAPLKRVLRASLAAVLHRCGWRGAARRVAAAEEGSCGTGCGSCGGCGSDTGAVSNEFSISPDVLRRSARRK